MTDRPILFSAPMVRALLAGTKTQTRRLLPHPEYYGCPTGDCPHNYQSECNQAMIENTAKDLRFAVGDRLWVKETWKVFQCFDAVKPSGLKTRSQIAYLADGRPSHTFGKTRVAIFMPRWASRLTLTVTAVRVEQLQSISDSDAIAEGIERGWNPHTNEPEGWKDYDRIWEGEPHRLAIIPWCHPRRSYRSLWDSINGPGSWASNPWVVAVTFTVEKRNIDR